MEDSSSITNEAELEIKKKKLKKKKASEKASSEKTKSKKGKKTPQESKGMKQDRSKEGGERSAILKSVFSGGVS